MADAAFSELPDRFGPMTVKELRQGLRRGSFVLPFLFIHLLAVLAMAAEFQTGDSARFNEHPGLLNVVLLVTSGPFWLVVTATCAVVMPLGGLVLMGQELDDANHELLLLTGLTRWCVVRGKFLALWGLCTLTFVSLLPYVVVRYLVGGIEPVRELACSATVVALAGMLSAGAIGASSFRGIAARVAMLLLFAGSMAAGCAPPLIASALVPHGFPIFYHLNALAACACYIALGLALARSRLRLVVHAYEVKPSWLVGGLLFFTPWVTVMTTAMSVGFAGFVGLLAMALIAVFADVSPGGRQARRPITAPPTSSTPIATKPPGPQPPVPPTESSTPQS